MTPPDAWRSIPSGLECLELYHKKVESVSGAMSEPTHENIANNFINGLPTGIAWTDDLVMDLTIRCMKKARKEERDRFAAGVEKIIVRCSDYGTGHLVADLRALAKGAA